MRRWSPQTTALIAGLLGILKAGGAYLALDASYPAERLLFMIEDAAVGVLLVEDGLLPPLDGVAARMVALDPEGADLGDEPADDPPLAQGPDALAYVVDTSGSTGQPKGCGATHRGIVRLVRDTDYATFDADQVFLQLAPISFDASTFEIWGPLLNGGRLVQVPVEMPTLDEIARTIENGAVTTVAAPSISSPTWLPATRRPDRRRASSRRFSPPACPPTCDPPRSSASMPCR